MKKKLNSMIPFSLTGLTCLQVLWHYCAADYFHSYLNQIPKPLNHRSYNLRVEKDWQYWINQITYYLNSLRNLIYCFKSYFLNTGFHKLVYTCFIVYVCVKKNLQFKKKKKKKKKLRRIYISWIQFRLTIRGLQYHFFCIFDAICVRL